MKNIDTSVTRMTIILKNISKMDSLLNSFHGNKGRKLYLTFLFLIYYFQPSSFTNISDLPFSLSKVRILLYTFIYCHLTIINTLITIYSLHFHELYKNLREQYTIRHL